MFKRTSLNGRNVWPSVGVFAAMIGVVSQGFASSKDDVHKLLVGLKETAHGKDFAKGIGQVVGTDPESHLLIVKLNDPLSAERAIQILRKRAGVELALPFSAKDVNRSSLASVRTHVAYLNAIDDDEKTTDSKHPHMDRADFYEALGYYLERHVAYGTDTVDYEAIRTGIDHRNQMPKTNIGLSTPDPTTPGAAPSNTWTFLGPKNLASPYNRFYGTPPLSGRITCIAYDPTTAATIYTGSGGGGLWKSTNSGSTWACVSDKTPWIYPAVSSIAIDPTNHNVLYVGTGDFDGFYPGYNQGIMKSTDGGTTWTNLASNVSGISNLAVSHIVIDPSNHLLITCSTGRGNSGGPNSNDGNIFRSTNGGTTWTSAGLQAANYCSLAISPVDGTYYATAGQGPALMYKSTNQGQTWTTITAPDNTTEEISSIACSQVTPGVIFALMPSAQKVYKSVNSGTSWTNITSNLPAPANSENNWSQSTYDYYIATAPAPSATSKELLFCGLITSCYSDNDGTTWVDYGNTYQSNNSAPALMHNDQHQFAFAPSNPNQILIGCDGGLFNLSVSGYTAGAPTVSFSSLNAGLGITQFYKIAPHPTDSTQALGGAQDNASPCAITNQGNYASWTNLYAGDGGWCDWDIPQNSLLTTSDQGSVYLYDITGSASNSIAKVGTENIAFVAPTLFSSDGSKIYLGGQTLQSYLISSNTLTFSPGTANLTNGTLSYVAVVPKDANTIYTGGNDGVLMMTSNAGSTWKEIDNGSTPGAVVGAIAPNNLADHDLLVGFQNTGIPHLWHCTNTTAATPAWTNVSGSGTTGLPDVPISAIYRSLYNPEYNWYVATDIGVFVTTNGGASWANANMNLPEVQIYDIKYSAGFLYVGTYGRGMWRIPLDDTLSNFTLTANSTVGGAMDYGTVTLNGVAGSSGQVVNLTTNSASVLIPTSVTVPANKASLTFEVGSQGVAANTGTTITASTGAVSRTLTFTLTPAALNSISLLHSSVVGGNNSAVTVYLNGKAPAGGLKVNLHSNNADATVIASITIPAQSTFGSAAITTKAVTVTTAVQITATAGSISKTATLTLTH